MKIVSCVAFPNLRQKVYSQEPQTSLETTRTVLLGSLLIIGGFVDRVRGSSFQLNADSVELLDGVDVAPTVEGWFGIWAAKEKGLYSVRGRRINITGEAFSANEEFIYTNELPSQFPAIDCSVDSCLIAWEHARHIITRSGRLLPMQVDFMLPDSGFGLGLSADRRPTVNCLGSYCTVGTTRDRGLGRFVQAQRYMYGMKVGGEFRISNSTLDHFSGVKLRNYNAGQIYLYSTLRNNTVIARTLQSANNSLEDEFSVSNSSALIRHWPQLDCLPSGLCAACWSEKSSESNSALQARWRLFNAQGIMLTGVLSDVNDVLADSWSVGLALTEGFMFRVWQQRENSDFYLKGQWITLNGVPVGSIQAITTESSDNLIIFSVRRRLDKVFVIWNEKSKKIINGHIFTAPVNTSSPSTQIATRTSVPSHVTTAQPTSLLSILRTSTRTSVSSHLTTAQPTSLLSILRTSIRTSVSTHLTTEQRSVLMTSKVNPPMVTTIKTLSTSYTKSASPETNLDIDTFPSTGAADSSYLVVDRTIVVVVGIISAVVCSIFSGMVGAWCRYHGRSETTADLDSTRSTGHSLGLRDPAPTADDAAHTRDSKEYGSFDNVIFHEYEQIHDIFPSSNTREGELHKILEHHPDSKQGSPSSSEFKESSSQRISSFDSARSEENSPPPLRSRVKRSSDSYIAVDLRRHLVTQSYSSFSPSSLAIQSSVDYDVIPKKNPRHYDKLNRSQSDREILYDSSNEVDSTKI